MILIDAIDSATIQAAVSAAADAGISFLPFPYKFLAPIISSLLTMITAAIIRHVESGQMRDKHNAEKSEIIKAYLTKDTEQLNKKLSEYGKQPSN